MGGIVLAAIDIHKAVFQAAVLNRANGEIVQERFAASREELAAWIEKWEGQLDAVAIEATTGWRWVARELQARGIDVRLTDAGQASALQGARKRPKNDRLDARWLVMLLAREMLPRGVAGARGDPAPARQDAAAQGADRRSHPLGAATARGPRARGLAMRARVAPDCRRPALGRRDPLGPGRARPGRDDAQRDADARAADRPARLRAAPARQCRRAAQGAAADLRD